MSSGGKILLCGSYHPFRTLRCYERALQKVGSVTYCGLPYGYERPGYAPDLDLAQIALEQRPEWFFYIHEWKSVFPRGLDKVPFPTVGYFPDSCLDFQKALTMASCFDYVFVGQRGVLGLFRRTNPRTYYLPFAVDPERTPRIFTREKLYDVASVGGLTPKRKKILSRIAQRFRTNDWEAQDVPPAQVGWVYSHSKIVFNCLPPSMPRAMDDDNLRVFEGLGCGSLVVTETCDGSSSSLFKPGKQLVTYAPGEDPLRVIEYYLENEEERARIAEEGYKEAIARHTFAQRVESIQEILRRNDFSLGAPLRVKDRSQVFLSYQNIFNRLMMLDSMANLLTQDEIPFIPRLRGVGYVVAAVGRRLRQMAWRKLANSLLRTLRLRVIARTGSAYQD